MPKPRRRKPGNGRRERQPVTLPTPPWETSAAGGDGRRYALARPRLVADAVEEDGVLDDAGTVQRRRASVWRAERAPWLRNLHPTLRAALVIYADAAERVAASGGTMDPTGAGGGRGGASGGPALARLAAAEKLRGIEAALGEGYGWVMTCRERGLVKARHRDLVRWAAVDGLTVIEVAERLGVDTQAAALRSHGGDKRLTAHLRDAAARVALHLGML